MESGCLNIKYLRWDIFVYKRLFSKGRGRCSAWRRKGRFFVEFAETRWDICVFFVPGYNLSLIVKITLQLLMIKWCLNYHLMCSESDHDRRVESITESHRVMAVVDSSNAAFVASPQCEPSSFQFQALISMYSMLAMLTNIWSFFRNLDYVCKEAGRFVN